MTRPTPTPNPAPPDHYEILSLLPFADSSAPLSKSQLKAAYHRALLRHHPDKTNAPPSVANHSSEVDMLQMTKAAAAALNGRGQSSQSRVYTIDEITSAYKTLSDPRLRAEYDRSLRLDRARAVEKEKNGTVFHTGLEVVDLEDLLESEDDDDGDGVYWYRGCRCGDEKGFLVREEDLEREIEHGEVVVGCRGCSLYMKVLFAVDDGEGEG